MGKAVGRVLILGGYGNFGKRIAARLSRIDGINVLIAGRNPDKADETCRNLQNSASHATLDSAAIDIESPDFLEKLRALAPDLVIHTSGPFQRQDYRVPEACIAISSHYIDLADDRRFVCDIASLNKQAVENGVLVISGASSVPGLSSTVIESLAKQFSQLEEIDFAIAPGNKAERGEATVRGILSYTGHPFTVLREGKWVEQYGWMDPRRLNFGKVIGKRWLANIDIPDLELFPDRYPGIKSVNFQAGIELPLIHFSMVFMAQLAKLGLVKSWESLTVPIFRFSELFKSFGTDVGGMRINLTGLDNMQRPKSVSWTLVAENGVGPYIPTISAIILAKKLIAGEFDTVGASACLGLFTLDEFDTEASPLGIYHETSE
ncbi:saccharopine dehydrogenase NADP-binding domain-containing protein [Microbulbifer sp.]|uniref:saccharopine dehydrogenase family protein n=1 Tax=Microbulbifer sp. TaxID=1908541 RepID=UPI0025888EDC|nr:saccharopine dehydrogenase NADP-binding domain-containing protein [Microbulbifer sp.]